MKLNLTTDPAPPEISARSHNTVSVTWPFVCFCGINPPALIDSVQYILEISEGVDYKPGYFTRFISDVCAVDYRPVCSGVNINSTTVSGLLPARWYHIRLCIEYLGQRFQSESLSIHTSTWVPSASTMPRVHILPVRSSFDLKSEAPVRLEMQVSWNPASANGCKVIKYQCQIQRFDAEGNVIEGAEAQVKRERLKRKPQLTSPDRDPSTNQWTASPGRNALQVHNSLVLGNRSPKSQGRTRRSRLGSPTTRDQSPNRLPQLSENSLQQSSSSIYTAQGRRFKWEILFENILTNVRTASPAQDEAEWHIRVRAKNAEGWSDFSPVLKINKLSHPSLFVPPPPMYCYGTCYFTEHGGDAYLNGNERIEFLASTPKTHAPAPEHHDTNSVNNELFLNHHLHNASLKRADTSEKPSPSRAQTQGQIPGQGQGQQTRSKLERGANNGSARLLEPMSMNLTINTQDSYSAPPRERTQHVLNFKEGNNWDAPTGAGSQVTENTGDAHSISPKKKDSLPSLTTKSGSNKFQRKGSNSRDVGNF